MEYTEVIFSDVDENAKDILVAMLADHHYEGFEDNPATLAAYIPSAHFDRAKLEEIAATIQASFAVNNIPSQNWNSTWESNFDAVSVDDFCTIRAHFHPPDTHVQHEIVITPKMSFGTGHHATTYMMISQMRSINFKGTRVLDFGTGTGVLAILAAKLGASEVVAIDNDQWSIDNATENIGLNNTPHVNVLLGENARVGAPVDIVLANITRNVITENFADIVRGLNPNGILLLSGLLKEDEWHIGALAQEHQLEQLVLMQKAQWICLKYRKTINSQL